MINRFPLIIRLVAIVLIATFIFQDVVWANPDIGQSPSSASTLQIPSFLSSATNENVLKASLLCLVKTFPDIEKLNLRLTPKIAGTIVEMDFRPETEGGKKRRDGENTIIPCSVSGNSYEAIITPDKEIYLRKAGSSVTVSDIREKTQRIVQASSAAPKAGVRSQGDTSPMGERTGPDDLKTSLDGTKSPNMKPAFGTISTMIANTVINFPKLLFIIGAALMSVAAKDSPLPYIGLFVLGFVVLNLGITLFADITGSSMPPSKQSAAEQISGSILSRVMRLASAAKRLIRKRSSVPTDLKESDILKDRFDFVSDPYIGEEMADKIKELFLNTNIIERTVHVLFERPISKEEIALIKFEYLGSGTYRSAHKVTLCLQDRTEYSFVLKIANWAIEKYALHQVVGRFLEPSRDVATENTGIWLLNGGRTALTEELVLGQTYGDFCTQATFEQLKTVQSNIVEHSIIFWELSNGVFINDPHKEQFVITDPKTLKVKIVDAGDVTLNTELHYKIANDGEIEVYDTIDTAISDVDQFAKKMAPSELIKRLIFELERPLDRESYGGFLAAENKIETPLSREAILRGAIAALGPEKALEFLKEAKGVDPELDEWITEFDNNPQAFFFLRKSNAHNRIPLHEAVNRVLGDIQYSKRLGIIKNDKELFLFSEPELRRILEILIKFWHKRLSLSYEWFPPTKYPSELIEAINNLLVLSGLNVADGLSAEKRIERLLMSHMPYISRRARRQALAEIFKYNPVLYAKFIEMLITHSPVNDMVKIEALANYDSSLKNNPDDLITRWKKLWIWGKNNTTLPRAEELSLLRIPDRPTELKVKKASKRISQKHPLINKYLSIFYLSALEDRLGKTSNYGTLLDKEDFGALLELLSEYNIKARKILNGGEPLKEDISIEALLSVRKDLDVLYKESKEMKDFIFQHVNTLHSPRNKNELPAFTRISLISTIAGIAAFVVSAIYFSNHSIPGDFEDLVISLVLGLGLSKLIFGNMRAHPNMARLDGSDLDEIYDDKRGEINMPVLEQLINDVAYKISKTYGSPVSAKIFGSLRYLMPDSLRTCKDMDILLDFDETKVPWDIIRYRFIAEVKQELEKYGTAVSLQHIENGGYMYPHIVVRVTRQEIFFDILPAFLLARQENATDLKWRVEDLIINGLKSTLGMYEGNVTKQRRGLQFYVAAEYYLGTESTWKKARADLLAIPKTDYRAIKALIEDPGRMQREKNLLNQLSDPNQIDRVRLLIRSRIEQPAWKSNPVKLARLDARVELEKNSFTGILGLAFSYEFIKNYPPPVVLGVIGVLVIIVWLAVYYFTMPLKWHFAKDLIYMHWLKFKEYLNGRLINREIQRLLKNQSLFKIFTIFDCFNRIAYRISILQKNKQDYEAARLWLKRYIYYVLAKEPDRRFTIDQVFKAVKSANKATIEYFNFMHRLYADAPFSRGKTDRELSNEFISYESFYKRVSDLFTSDSIAILLEEMSKEGYPFILINSYHLEEAEKDEYWYGCVTQPISPPGQLIDNKAATHPRGGENNKPAFIQPLPLLSVAGIAIIGAIFAMIYYPVTMFSIREFANSDPVALILSFAAGLILSYFIHGTGYVKYKNTGSSNLVSLTRLNNSIRYLVNVLRKIPMALRQMLSRIFPDKDSFYVDKDSVFSEPTTLKVRYWKNPLYEFKNKDGFGRREIELTGDVTDLWVPLYDPIDDVILLCRLKSVHGNISAVKDFFIFRLKHGRKSERLLYFENARSLPIPVWVPLVDPSDKRMTGAIFTGIIRSAIGAAKLILYLDTDALRKDGVLLGINPDFSDENNLKAKAKIYIGANGNTGETIVFNRNKRRGHLPDLLFYNTMGTHMLAAEFGIHDVWSLAQKYTNSLGLLSEIGRDALGVAENSPDTVVFYAEKVVQGTLKEKYYLADSKQLNKIGNRVAVIEERTSLVGANVIKEDEYQMFLKMLQEVINRISSNVTGALPKNFVFIVDNALALHAKRDLFIPCVVKFTKSPSGKYEINKNNIYWPRVNKSLAWILRHADKKLRSLQLERRFESSDPARSMIKSEIMKPNRRIALGESILGRRIDEHNRPAFIRPLPLLVVAAVTVIVALAISYSSPIIPIIREQLGYMHIGDILTVSVSALFLYKIVQFSETQFLSRKPNADNKIKIYEILGVKLFMKLWHLTIGRIPVKENDLKLTGFSEEALRKRIKKADELASMHTKQLIPIIVMGAIICLLSWLGNSGSAVPLTIILVILNILLTYPILLQKYIKARILNVLARKKGMGVVRKNDTCFISQGEISKKEFNVGEYDITKKEKTPGKQDGYLEPNDYDIRGGLTDEQKTQIGITGLPPDNKKISKLAKEPSESMLTKEDIGRFRKKYSDLLPQSAKQIPPAPQRDEEPMPEDMKGPLRVQLMMIFGHIKECAEAINDNQELANIWRKLIGGKPVLQFGYKIKLESGKWLSCADCPEEAQKDLKRYRYMHGGRLTPKMGPAFKGPGMQLSPDKDSTYGGILRKDQNPKHGMKWGKIEESEILEQFKKGAYRIWDRSTKEAKLHMFNLLAKAVGKEPGALNTWDLRKRIPEFNNKGMGGLLGWVSRRSACDTDSAALKELKRYLGIKEMINVIVQDITEENILELFKKGTLYIWKRSTPKAKLHLVNMLAKSIGKEPGALNTPDFSKPISEFGNKCLAGLLSWAQFVEFKCDTRLAALKELKKHLNITEILEQKREKWVEKTKDWDEVCRIIKKYMDTDVSLSNIDDFLQNVRLDKNTFLALACARQNGNGAAKDALVKSCHKMVHYFSSRFSQTNRDIDEDDFVNAGRIALDKAAEMYDPEIGMKKGASFSTYCAKKIIFGMAGCIRENRGEEKQYIQPETSPDGHEGYMANVPAREETFQENSLSKDQEKMIRDILSAKLKEKNRKRNIEIFISYLQGETQRKIAKRTGFTSAHISTITIECRKILRNVLDIRGGLTDKQKADRGLPPGSVLPAPQKSEDSVPENRYMHGGRSTSRSTKKEAPKIGPAFQGPGMQLSPDKDSTYGGILRKDQNPKHGMKRGKIEESEILEQFKKGAYRIWDRSTKEAKLHMFNLLAKAVGKEPGALNTEDFKIPIPEFDNKSLDGLLGWAMRRFKCGTKFLALKELKRYLNINDIVKESRVVIEYPEKPIAKNYPIARDIKNHDQLVKGMLETVISMLLSGEKVVLAFHKDTKGYEFNKYVFKALDALKRKPGFDKLLKNLVIVESFDSSSDLNNPRNLVKQLNEMNIDAADMDHNVIFTYAPLKEKENLVHLGVAVHPVYIDEDTDENGISFNPSVHYYPLFEMVLLSLIKYRLESDFHSDNPLDALKGELAKLGIDTADVNIKDFTDKDAFLIFRLIPKAERNNVQKIADRYALIKEAIASAA